MDETDSVDVVEIVDREYGSNLGGNASVKPNQGSGERKSVLN